MINNFICEDCDHYIVCEKRKHLKFHESAKKDLMMTITMNDCLDYTPDADTKERESDADSEDESED